MARRALAARMKYAKLMAHRARYTSANQNSQSPARFLTCAVNHHRLNSVASPFEEPHEAFTRLSFQDHHFSSTGFGLAVVAK